MSRRGAKPLPTNVKALHGTLRKHRANAHEPKAQPGMPGCPAELSGIAHATPAEPEDDAFAQWLRRSDEMHRRRDEQWRRNGLA
jgi:hypothetical protein